MILGVWSGHDANFALLDDSGKVLQHCEIERHVREKEPAADSLEWFKKFNKNFDNIDIIATCWSTDKLKKSPLYLEILNKKFHIISHHEAHAADARYSSKFNECAVLVVDGGGYDDAQNTTIATSIWHAPDVNTLTAVHKIKENQLNVGGVWTRATRYVFGLESGWPQGHQAGSVMAMAAFGDSTKYINRFRQAFTTNRLSATSTPQGHIKGMSAKHPNRPKHHYFKDLEELAMSSTQEMYDIAAGLQAATEEILLSLIDKAAQYSKNICLTGGVALNTMFVGHLHDLRPDLNIFVPAVPYDAGLTIGAAKHYLHVVKKQAWAPSVNNNVPYYGTSYNESEIMNVVDTYTTQLNVNKVSDEFVLKLLADQKIVAVFSGRSESGRRALGHRSILADPRSSSMKDHVNQKVKHRQSYRPFAPSILREHVKDWFKHDVDAPYMNTVIQVKDNKKNQIPAVIHIDNSARLQTLTKEDNGWYYDFISKWFAISGVPMLLNTSFNDREPICESPQDALTCFMNTNVDALYFTDYGILVTKQ
jgi:carbamoyltransferase